jgi:hypothetical protein
MSSRSITEGSWLRLRWTLRPHASAIRAVSSRLSCGTDQPRGEDCSDRPAPLRPRHDFRGQLRGHGWARRSTRRRSLLTRVRFSYPYTLGFVLPPEARDDVVLDLGIDNWKHDRAVFAGSIAAG